MIPFKKRRKMYPLILAGIIMLGLSFVLDRIDQKDHYKAEPFAVTSAQNFETFNMNRSALNTFIEDHFMEEGLMTVNIKDLPQRDIPGGKDRLSQSVGLLLLYEVETDQAQAFNAQFKLAQKKLQKENGLFQWRTRPGQPLVKNTSADDLRIAKALMLASNRWGEPAWRREAQTISESLMSHCVKEGYLLASDAEKAPKAKLYELDLAAMLMLAEFDPEWEVVAKNSLKQIQKSRFPYNPFYILSKADDSAYLTVENTLVILHLAQTGQNNINDLRWLKFQLKRGPLYESYNSLGKAVSQRELPAIYGIIAQIGKYTGDQELYTLACDHLVDMQNKGFGDFSGGYTDTPSGEGYAFDQLMALLGY